MRSFDEFGERDTLTARDLQDYTSRYQDTWTEWKARQPQRDQADINDDIVFEVELIKQIEINIDYILALVEKYRGSHGEDKELLVSIQSAIGSSPSLRSKEDLIEAFIANINTMEDDVLAAWRKHVAEQQEKELSAIIAEEHLKDAETRKFIEDSFANGEIKTIGTDIDKLMPPMSKFGAEGAKRKERKQKIIERLQAFFERFFGIR